MVQKMYVKCAKNVCQTFEISLPHHTVQLMSMQKVFVSPKIDLNEIYQLFGHDLWPPKGIQTVCNNVDAMICFTITKDLCQHKDCPIQLHNGMECDV